MTRDVSKERNRLGFLEMNQIKSVVSPVIGTFGDFPLIKSMEMIISAVDLHAKNSKEKESIQSICIVTENQRNVSPSLFGTRRSFKIPSMKQLLKITNAIGLFSSDFIDQSKKKLK